MTEREEAIEARLEQLRRRVRQMLPTDDHGYDDMTYWNVFEVLIQAIVGVEFREEPGHD